MSPFMVSDGKMTNVDVFQWAAVLAEGSAEVGRKTISGLGASLKRVQIKAGAMADRHSHPHEQFVIVLEGGGRLECEAGTVALRPDTVLHFASGAWHSVVFETDTVLLEVNLAA